MSYEIFIHDLAMTRKEKLICNNLFVFKVMAMLAVICHFSPMCNAYIHYTNKRINSHKVQLLSSSSSSSSIIEKNDGSKDNLKLPIIHIYRQTELSTNKADKFLVNKEESNTSIALITTSLEGEFFCGQDVEFSLRKVSFVLRSLSSNLSAKTNILKIPNDVQIINVYSDTQINSLLFPTTSTSSSVQFPTIQYIDKDRDKDEATEAEVEDTSHYVVVYIARQGCQQCILAEPLYASLAASYGSLHTTTPTTITDSNTVSATATTAAVTAAVTSDNNPPCFQFVKCDESYIPDFMTSLKRRLSGVRDNDNRMTTADTITATTTAAMATAVVESVSCATCADSGFVECSDCQGKGFIQRFSSTSGSGSGSGSGATVAVFCPTCTGCKRTRCPTCGGKCFKCSV